MGKMSVYTSEYPLSYHRDHYDNWSVKDHILLSWKIYISFEAKNWRNIKIPFVYKETDSLTFSGNLLLIYFSIGKEEYSTSVSITTPWRRGTGRGLVSSRFNLWEQLVLLVIQTKWSHVNCKFPLAWCEWGLVLNKRKTALHLTTAKSFVGQTGITYRLQPINNAPQVICILATL